MVLGNFSNSGEGSVLGGVLILGEVSVKAMRYQVVEARLRRPGGRGCRGRESNPGTGLLSVSQKI